MEKKVFERIAEQTGDKIFSWETCRRTGKPFAVFQSERELLDQISPTIKGKKYFINTPKLSPEARELQRLLFRNDRVFYKSKSSHDGKGMISIYAPSFQGQVREVNDRYQDTRNPFDYGQDSTNPKEVFPSLQKMMLQVPRLNVDGVGNTNSDYCNYCGYCKDCYMDIAGENNEGCYYCLFTKYSKKCVDCTFVYNSEYCYETISSYNCNKVVYSQYLENCHNCYFSFDLKNCKNCLRCRNLRNQDYHIFNQKVSEAEFQRQLQQIINGGFASYLAGIQKYNKIKEQFIYPATFKINAENAIGNDIKDIKNSKVLFNASEIEQSLYLYDVLHAKHCLDLNYSLYHPELSYQLVSTLELKQSICNFATHHSHSVFYCQLCNNCHDCFACIGLNNQSYCIFNKQYSKEAYYDKLSIIVENLIQNWTWWAFFPPQLSPHPYNDTVAIEYFPLQKIRTMQGDQMLNEQILNPEGEGTLTLYHPEKFISEALLDLGGEEKIPILWRTQNQEINIPEGIHAIQAEQLDMVLDKKELLTKAVICTSSQRPFRFVKPELEFYEMMQVPLPRLHPDIRHLERIKIRSSRNLHIRSCDATGEEILSVYPANTKFKVYSEKAYTKAIYG